MRPTVTELMTETIKTSFIPEKAEGVDTVIQLTLTGTQAANWHLIVKDQKCESIEGVHPDPKMTMTVDSEDYIKMAIGEMDATMAFLRGKVKVTGDMSVALKMGQYIKYG